MHYILDPDFSCYLIKICCFTETHITHLRSKNEETINWLLGMVVDVDNMYTAMSRQENPETKKVYLYFYKVSIVLSMYCVLLV